MNIEQKINKLEQELNELKKQSKECNLNIGILK